MILQLAILLQVNKAFQMPVMQHPGAGAEVSTRITQLCPIADADDKNAMFSREIRTSDDATSKNAAVSKLIDLGCLRARLAMAGAIGREGPLMPLGASYEQGAVNVFAAAVLKMPTDTVAAVALGTLALDLFDLRFTFNVKEALKTAIDAGTTKSAVIRAGAELALRDKENETASRYAIGALQNGGDSTAANIVLARVAYRSGDSVLGVQRFASAAMTARDSSQRRQVEWHLQWFLSPDEQKTWDSLADSARGRWMRDRLMSRDVRDGQPIGARLGEHFGRLEYVDAHFRMDVPKLMRKALLDGAANSERSGPKTSCDAAAIPSDSLREYNRWQLDYDDRGIAWMRYGGPEKRVTSFNAPSVGSNQCAAATGLGGGRNPGAGNAGSARAGSLNTSGIGNGLTAPGVGESQIELPREVWLYHIDGKPLILNFEGEKFDGSVEATRFVTGVLGNYMCGVDQQRCNLSAEYTAEVLAGNAGINNNLSTSGLRPEQYTQLRTQDRQNLERVVTTDDNSPRGEKPIQLSGELHRLWDPVTGNPLTLVSYAVQVSDLATVDLGGQQGVVLDIALRQWDPGIEKLTDTTINRKLRLPAKLSGNEQITGAIVLPATSGVTAWSLIATQSDHRRGRAAEEQAPPLDVGGLILSDIVLGVEAQGLTTKIGGTTVTLAPLGTVERKQRLHVYYQVKSSVVRAGLETRVALYRMDGTPKQALTPALDVKFPAPAHTGLNEIDQIIDVSRLEAGSYRMDTILTDPVTKATTKRSTRLLVK